MKQRIYLSLAHMGGREQEFIKEAFDTNWVVPLGPNVNAFEQELAAYVGQDRHVVALSAGTAAIHLGLVQLGVKAGDEVICQSFTFAASANPVTYLGATPVFVDSEKDTWNMAPEFLEKAILDRKEKPGNFPKQLFQYICTACLPNWTKSGQLPKNTAFLCWKMLQKHWGQNIKDENAEHSENLVH